MTLIAWILLGIVIALLLIIYFIVSIHKDERKELRFTIGHLKHENRSLSRANVYLSETNKKLHKFYRDLYSQK